MIVSAVDLLDVFGRSFVCLPDLPQSGQFGGNHVVIYRFLVRINVIGIVLKSTYLKYDMFF